MQKNSYKRIAYESVDDKSLSQALSEKLMVKKSWAVQGWTIISKYYALGYNGNIKL